MSVYFAKVGEFVKVGYSTQPWTRVSTITYGAIVTPEGVESGDLVTLLGWYPGDFRDERAAHLALGQHYVCGEWFHDHPDVRARLKSHPDHVPATEMSGFAFLAVVKRGMNAAEAMEKWPMRPLGDMDGIFAGLGEST